MKSFKPRVIAFWFSLIIAVVVTLFAVCSQTLMIEQYGHYLFLFLGNLIVVYAIASVFLKGYIEKRLQPIFKIIRNVPLEESKKAKQVSFKVNMKENVSDEVSKWSNDKQAEIQRLRGLERYRKEFVGNVSHELKTPIFNIQGYILTLIEGGIDDRRINKLYLKRTVKSIDRMISIVEDLESITKLESGVLKLNKENFDLARMVDDVFEIEHMIAKERKITLVFSNRHERPVMVKADKKRMMEVISNLVINGIKYGRKGGRVEVGFFDMDNHVMVEIKDNGIGIEQEHLIRIFERFYRVDKHRSREQGGTGLGLAIVKHIIEAHDQTIDVKSQPDVGTTFNFTIEKAVI